MKENNFVQRFKLKIRCTDVTFHYFNFFPVFTSLCLLIYRNIEINKQSTINSVYFGLG